jgi:hypothetical protein
MGKYDVDFDDYEESTGGYDGEEPKKGIYSGKLVQLNEHTSGEGNESLRWVFEITEGDYAGWRGYVYSNMTTAKWKTQEMTLAIAGGKKAKMSLKPGAEGKADEGRESATVKKAKPIRIRVINEMYEEERKARIRNILPAKADKSSKDAGDEPDGKKGNKKKKDEPF